MPRITSLFPLISVCKSLLFCTTPQSSFLSAGLDAAWFELSSVQQTLKTNMPQFIFWQVVGSTGVPILYGSLSKSDNCIASCPAFCSRGHNLLSVVGGFAYSYQKCMYYILYIDIYVCIYGERQTDGDREQGWFCKAEMWRDSPPIRASPYHPVTFFEFEIETALSAAVTTFVTTRWPLFKC